MFCFTELDILKRFFELDMHVLATAISMEKLFLQLDIAFLLYLLGNLTCLCVTALCPV